MKCVSSYICLKDVRFYAFHGVMPQECEVGGDYLVNLRVGYPLAAAMRSDRVEDTLDYAALFRLVSKEMQQPSGLIEHVAGRIADAIETSYPEVTSIDLELTKQCPPMGADCGGASIEIHLKKE